MAVENKVISKLNVQMNEVKEKGDFKKEKKGKS